VRRGARIAFALAFSLRSLSRPSRRLADRRHRPGFAAAGWAYTGGPRPIAYTPLGELFVLLFFGVLAVGGSYYLQTLSISPAAVLAGAIVGLFAAAVITVNNTRDRETDARAGRRTLAVVCSGRGRGLGLRGELLLPFVLCPGWPCSTGRGLWLALPFLVLPLGLRLIARFRRAAAGRVQRTARRTAGLQLLFALLLAGGAAGLPSGSALPAFAPAGTRRASAAGERPCRR
jgi:1,4-dihydroxy-2-naphthoate octaprenyltransferase